MGKPQTASAWKPKMLSARNLPKLFTMIGLLFGAAVMMFPFLWGLSVSLQEAGKSTAIPPQFFIPPYRFANYADVINKMDFLTYFINSVVISVLCIIGNVFSNAFIAFGFAKYKFKGSGVLFFALLCTMMLPGNILIIPLYVMWNTVGGIDTIAPLVVPAFFGGAFNIFLMRQCFLSLPGDLYEAAIIDGAKPPAIFARIYFPLSKATLATIAVMTFMGSWNDMFHPLIYLTSQSKYTISLGLLYIKGAFQYNNELLMAAAMIAMCPTLILYIFAQKYFVGGVAAGAVKG